jgi:ATP-dependent DNA ligase
MADIELNGDDLRRDPLEVRKATLVSVLAKAGPGLRLNEHLEHDDGETVFRHACKLGLEGMLGFSMNSPTWPMVAASAPYQYSGVPQFYCVEGGNSPVLRAAVAKASG